MRANNGEEQKLATASTSRRKRLPLKPRCPRRTTSWLCRMKKKVLTHQERC